MTSTKNQKDSYSRTYSITRNKAGECYNAKVVDSYGNHYQNYFQEFDEANEWIYYIFDKEDEFNSSDQEELLSKAILECKEIDSKNPRLRNIL
jgi:hypothetical protein